MTSKEKAEELMDKMLGIGDEHHHCTHYVAKQCALIAVDEILQADMFMMTLLQEMWWVEVRQNIEKL